MHSEKCKKKKKIGELSDANIFNQKKFYTKSAVANA